MYGIITIEPRTIQDFANNILEDIEGIGLPPPPPTDHGLIFLFMSGPVRYEVNMNIVNQRKIRRK